jgi:hypothetical protein
MTVERDIVYQVDDVYVVRRGRRRHDYAVCVGYEVRVGGHTHAIIDSLYPRTVAGLALARYRTRYLANRLARGRRTARELLAEDSMEETR